MNFLCLLYIFIFIVAATGTAFGAGNSSLNLKCWTFDTGTDGRIRRGPGHPPLIEEQCGSHENVCIKFECERRGGADPHDYFERSCGVILEKLL